jgi:hypothetical protein
MIVRKLSLSLVGFCLAEEKEIKNNNYRIHCFGGVD